MLKRQNMSDVRIFILDTEIAELRLSHKGEFSLSRKTSSFIGILFQCGHYCQDNGSPSPRWSRGWGDYSTVFTTRDRGDRACSGVNARVPRPGLLKKLGCHEKESGFFISI